MALNELSRAVILRSQKYSDHSVIVSAYTQAYGKIAFMVKGIGNSRKNRKQQFLQALFLVQLNLSYKAKRELQFVSTISAAPPLSSIPFVPAKSAIAFFLAEVLDKIFTNEERSDIIFEFISNSIQTLDLMKSGVGNFHLLFLLKLTKYIGFEIENISPEHEVYYFDLLHGFFQPQTPGHGNYLSADVSRKLRMMLDFSYSDADKLKLGTTERAFILDKILEYYKLQLDVNWTLKSLPVLKTLF